MIPVDDALDSLAKTILALPDFRVAPQRTALFQHLWLHRDEYSRPVDIWDEALHELSGSRKKHDDNYNFEESVRQQCLDLRRFLRKYFARATRGWCVFLPEALPRRGYRLQCIKLDDPQSMTLAFWGAHLSGSREITIVHPEKLFYQDWPNRFTFRYAYLNASDEQRALHELKLKQPALYNEHVVAAHPYVTAGDIGARDLIAEWFSEKALVKVRTAIAGRMDDRVVAENSLILFGSAATNEMIADVLRSPTARHLVLSLQSDGLKADGTPFSRIKIKGDLKPEELSRFEPFRPVREGSDYYIYFTPEEGTELAILTRLRSPFCETAVTIFNSVTGSAVEQIAHLFTDEERLYRGIKFHNWPIPMPESFEILYAIPIGSIATEYRRALLEPLLWRLH